MAANLTEPCVCITALLLLLAITVQGNRRGTVTTPSPKVKHLQVVPGGGWDNLRNLDMARVVELNYSLGRHTPDGKFRIPDAVRAASKARLHIRRTPELFQHWHQYTSATAHSVNVFGGISEINGRFASDFMGVKRNQIQMRSVTTRAQARYSAYALHLRADAQISTSFKNRILSIEGHFRSKQASLAKYESELLVRDFGTHVITKLILGAAIIKEDDIQPKFVSQHGRASVQNAAKFAFYKFLEIEGYIDTKPDSYGRVQESPLAKHEKMQVGYNLVNSYLSHVMGSNVQRTGSLALYDAISMATWVEKATDNMAPIDHSGKPIYDFITTSGFPELPTSSVIKLYQTVRAAVYTYYNRNTHRGCTDPSARNFDYLANVPDDTCEALWMARFGGTVQTCIKTTLPYFNQTPCDSSYVRTNALTGDTTCPPGYYKAFFGQTTKISVVESFDRLGRRLSSGRETELAIHNYWCAEVKTSSSSIGYSFGGMYSNTVNNPLTKKQSCPDGFRPQRLVYNSTDLVICVGDEGNTKTSLEFGGLLRCDVGNPFVADNDTDWFHLKPDDRLSSYRRCPPDHKTYYAGSDNGCAIRYCGRLRKPVALGPFRMQLPPYTVPSYNPHLDLVSTTALLEPLTTPRQLESIDTDSLP